MIIITDKGLALKVHNSMYQQWQRRGYAAAVDTLIDCGALTVRAYNDWRFGKVQYLERVCTVNLRKLSFILHEMKAFAEKNKWKSSFCFYKRWGVKGKTIPLRFSKSGNADIEKRYATHYVDTEKIKQIKSKAVV